MPYHQVGKTSPNSGFGMTVHKNMTKGVACCMLALGKAVLTCRQPSEGMTEDTLAQQSWFGAFAFQRYGFDYAKLGT